MFKPSGDVTSLNARQLMTWTKLGSAEQVPVVTLPTTKLVLVQTVAQPHTQRTWRRNCSHMFE